MRQEVYDHARRNTGNWREALRLLRESQALTVQELSDSIEVSPSMISRAERGQRKPTRNILIRWLLIGLSLDVKQANEILEEAEYARI